MGKGVNMLPAQLEFCTTTGMKSAKKKMGECHKIWDRSTTGIKSSNGNHDNCPQRHQDSSSFL